MISRMKTRSKEKSQELDKPQPDLPPSEISASVGEETKLAQEDYRCEEVARSNLPLSFENLELSPPKKVKKHKHKKHKKMRVVNLQAAKSVEETGLSHLKLKIKLGGETFATKSVSRSSVTDAVFIEQDLLHNLPVQQEQQQQTPGDEEACLLSDKKVVEEDDEEAWLEALEAGELNEHGELKKEKDVNLLTARQKALRQVKEDDGPQDSGPCQLLAPGSSSTLEITEEMVKKREVRAQRRRDQAQKKDMENKKQTIERLLKKQEVKTKLQKSGKPRRKDEPSPQIHYVNSIDGISLSYPEGTSFPLIAKTPISPPKPVSCGVEGCENLKRYSCSKTGVPLCSLECYKKNISQMVVTTG